MFERQWASLDGFREVLGVERVSIGEVGDGSGDLGGVDTM